MENKLQKRKFNGYQQAPAPRTFSRRRIPLPRYGKRTNALNYLTGGIKLEPYGHSARVIEDRTTRELKTFGKRFRDAGFSFRGSYLGPFRYRSCSIRDTHSAPPKTNTKICFPWTTVLFQNRPSWSGGSMLDLGKALIVIIPLFSHGKFGLVWPGRNHLGCTQPRPAKINVTHGHGFLSKPSNGRIFPFTGVLTEGSRKGPQMRLALSDKPLRLFILRLKVALAAVLEPTRTGVRRGQNECGFFLLTS